MSNKKNLNKNVNKKIFSLICEEILDNQSKVEDKAKKAVSTPVEAKKQATVAANIANAAKTEEIKKAGKDLTMPRVTAKERNIKSGTSRQAVVKVIVQILMKKRLLYSLYPVIALLILLGLWSIEANRIGTEIILPSPSVTAKEIIKSFSDKKFLYSAINSVWHMAKSFTLAFLLALLVGTLAGLVKAVHKFLYLIIVILRVVPTMSVILLAIIWFKDESRPIFIAFLVSFPLLYNEVYSAVSSCDKDLVEMSLVYKVRKRDKLLYFYLPTISEKMFDGVLSVLGLNVKLVIAAESIAQTRLTLGMLMYSVKVNLETGRLFAYTIIAILISCLLEGILRLIRYSVKKAVKR